MVYLELSYNFCKLNRELRELLRMADCREGAVSIWQGELVKGQKRGRRTSWVGVLRE